MICANCHPTGSTAVRTGMPDAPECMICHRAVKRDSPGVEAVRAFAEQRRSIPWIRIYKLPDFVFFSHERHVKSGAACAECHGPVERRDVLAKEVSTSITACMACHIRNTVSTDCSVRHELGQ